MMGGFVDEWVIGLALATLRGAAPLVLAALGGLFCERAGVVNIALEGLMLVGAFFGYWGSIMTGSWIGGLVIGVGAAVLFSLLHAVATVSFHADQIISGTALVIMATGITGFLYGRISAGGLPSEYSKAVFPDALPLVGGMNMYLPLSIVLVWVTAFVVFKTRFGLRLRSVGEHPKAADTVGIDVVRMRYIAVLLSGALAGLAGVYLITEVVFNEGMSSGRGFIALAALIFGKWRPWGAFGASVLFGFSLALGDRLQSIGYPSEIMTALPYIITVVALAGFIGKAIPPAAVGKPYVKA
jgi:simple sugar transport system permease protein